MKLIVTSAPIDYDYGTTRLLCEHYGEADGKPVRLVRVEDDARGEYQAQRYGSGMNFVRSKAEFDKEAAEYPQYYKLTPDDQIEHHYFEATLPDAAFGNKEFVTDCYMPLTKQEGIVCKCQPNSHDILIHSTNKDLFDYTVLALQAGCAKLKLS